MESRIIARGVELRKGTRNLLEERIMIGIRRYHDRLRRCVARVARTGTSPDRWTCAISADIDAGPHLDVAANAGGCEECVECAMHKLKEKLRKVLGEKSPMHQSARTQFAVTPTSD